MASPWCSYLRFSLLPLDRERGYDECLYQLTLPRVSFATPAWFSSPLYIFPHNLFPQLGLVSSHAVPRRISNAKMFLSLSLLRTLKIVFNHINIAIIFIISCLEIEGVYSRPFPLYYRSFSYIVFSLLLLVFPALNCSRLPHTGSDYSSFPPLFPPCHANPPVRFLFFC